MEGLEAIASEVQDSVQEKSTVEKKRSSRWVKGESGNKHGRKIRLSDAGGYIDLLAEFEWRLSNPNETPKTPPQKMVLEFYQKNFENFVAQYNELMRAKLDKELAARPLATVAREGDKLELTERDLTIDEAIDRVIMQLQEMEDGEQ